MRLSDAVNLFGAAIFVPVLVLGLLSIVSPYGVAYYPVLHMIIILVIMASGLLFAWYSVQGFRSTGSIRLLLLAIGLAWSAIFFIGHILFEFGAEGRAEWYDRIAVFIAAIFIFLAAGFMERWIDRVHRMHIIWLAVLLTVAGIGMSVILIESALGQHIMVQATLERWTPLGRFLQIVSVVLLTTASIRYLHGAFIIRSEISLLFATGVVLLAMSELTFAQVAGSYDIAFWASHLWKALGFLSFLFGVIVASRALHTGATETSAPLPKQ